MAGKKFCIITHGCQANLADSEKIEQVLLSTGYRIASDENSADLLIYNTCSVRQKAEDRVFGLNKKFHELKTKNRKLIIVITGCMLHYSEKELREKMPDVDFFIDQKNINKLPKILGLKPKKQVGLSVSKKSTLIPISYGCNNFCSYCIVPFSRGRETSRPVKEILKEAKMAIANGTKEIWLLGQNVNSYPNFPGLLKKINNLPGEFWIRFTSPHPKDFGDDLIKVMAECKKFPHYINLPVQSGNNEILKKMHRPYTAEHYKKLVAKIRKAIPDISLSTDIIVGFPGETKRRFMDTAKLMREIKFDMAFLSEYSPRSKTLAWKLYKDNVPHAEKEWRKNYLNEILKKTAGEKNKKLVGQVVTVLNGRTEGYKQIEPENGQFPKNQFLKAKVIKATTWSLKGKLL